MRKDAEIPQMWSPLVAPVKVCREFCSLPAGDRVFTGQTLTLGRKAWCWCWGRAGLGGREALLIPAATSDWWPGKGSTLTGAWTGPPRSPLGLPCSDPSPTSTVFKCFMLVKQSDCLWSREQNLSSKWKEEKQPPNISLWGQTRHSSDPSMPDGDL